MSSNPVCCRSLNITPQCLCWLNLPETEEKTTKTKLDSRFRSSDSHWGRAKRIDQRYSARDSENPTVTYNHEAFREIVYVSHQYLTLLYFVRRSVFKKVTI